MLAFISSKQTAEERVKLKWSRGNKVVKTRLELSGSGLCDFLLFLIFVLQEVDF